MGKPNAIKLAFYGDDFTGSTDALEFLSRAGVRTVLFLDNPSPEQLEQFQFPEAIGVAGMTRAMSPKDMEKTLKPAFKALKALHPDHIHYKVCSTFDSSPETGNIGTAIQTGIHIFKSACTPILVAAPHLGRFSVFGNLFARMGIGSQGVIHRLDRHPSMSRHPVTPADESDLRLHLAKQTDLPAGLIDLIDLEKSENTILEKINQLNSGGKKVIFFDAMYEHQMAKIGSVLEQLSQKSEPLFSVGSSGIEKALGDHWLATGQFEKREKWEPLNPAKPLLVISGSVSPVTAAQIDWAVAQGFISIDIPPAALFDPSLDNYIIYISHQILPALRAGKSVILHTAKGPDDPRKEYIQSWMAEKGWSPEKQRSWVAQRLGTALGRIARKMLEQFPLKRLVIAGGDTSSYAARELGITAVEMIAPLYPGAPLCRAYAPGSPVDGKEVNLKGGQVGDERYFGVLEGSSGLYRE